MARGLKQYPQRWRNENRRYLGYQRLDLDTETLLEDSPNWTNEEIDAWLDWDTEETIEVERQEEADYIARGGPSTERGIKGLWGQIGTSIQAEREQYRFA